MNNSSWHRLAWYPFGDSLPVILSFYLSIAAWCVVASRSEAQSMSPIEAESRTETVSFHAVQPILRKHCVRCHNEDQPRGDLVLSSLDKVLAGSSSGPVVVAGKLDQSPLYTLTAHLDTPKMPPNKPQIPQRELNVIERWIVTGLADETQPTTSKHIQPERKPESVPLSPVVYSPLRALPQATAIRAMATHPSEPVVVLAGLHQVAILDSTTASFASQAIDIGERNISAIRFSPDGKILLIAVGIVGESGTVLVLDWSTKQWLPNLCDESDNIQSIDCNTDASQIAIGTTSRMVKIMDRKTQKELHIHRKHTDWVLSVAYSHDGIVLASGDRFGGIHVWETESGNEFATLRGHTGGITGLVWSSDGNWLTSSSLDGSVRVWNMHTFESDKQWVAHERGVLSLASVSDGCFVTSGRDGWIRKWPKDGLMAIGQSKLPDEAIAVVGVGTSVNPNTLFCTDAAGGIYRFDSLAMASSSEPISGTTISWPLSHPLREFASIDPIGPKRIIRADTKDRNSESVIQSAMVPSKSEIPPGLGEPIIASDLEESRRALASVELSLEQAYRTVEQLEESVARLKQLIAIQEARLKQAELRQKLNRK
jgi:hypothetical protein